MVVVVCCWSVSSVYCTVSVSVCGLISLCVGGGGLLLVGVLGVLYSVCLCLCVVCLCVGGGGGLLLVGVLGPQGHCGEVSVRHISESQCYVVSYCPSVTGQHVIVVKWADQHINGSPFYVNVLHQ